MPYITKSNSNRIYNTLLPDKISDLGEKIYKIPIYFLSKKRKKKLLLYKEFLQKPDTVNYTKRNKSQDKHQFVFEGGSPAYHNSPTCKRLNSSYENYTIPTIIKEKGVDAVKDYRKWFKANIPLLKSDPVMFYGLLHIDWGIQPNDFTSQQKAHTGIEKGYSFNLHELEDIIDNIIYMYGKYYNKNPHLQPLIRKFQKRTEIVYIKNIDLEITLIDSAFTPSEIFEHLVQWENKFSNPIFNYLKEYYRVKVNPDLQFEEPLLKQLGFKPCKMCCYDQNYTTSSTNSIDDELLSLSLKHPMFFIDIVSLWWDIPKNLIDKNKHKWNWENLCSNKNFSWSESFVRKYMTLIDGESLACNEAFPWTRKFIKEIHEEEYETFFSLDLNEDGYEILNLVPGFDDIESKIYKDDALNDFTNWISVSWDTNTINWTKKFIEHHENKWHEYNCWDGLSWNSKIPWTEDLIYKYRHCWHWGRLSRNESLPWSLALVEKYSNFIDWRTLSYNSKIPWTEDFIIKYENKWNWKGLSGNKGLPWSNSFFKCYLYRWNWGEMGYSGLSGNNALHFTPVFIEEYKYKWNWELLSSNKGVPWSIQLLDKYSHNWDWNELSSNTSIPWSINLIKRYENKWNWNSLAKNKRIWELIFFPYIKEDLVKKIIINA